MHFLGIDLGTTNFKACLADSSGQPLAIAQHTAPVEHPSSGRAEMTIDALRETIAALIEEVHAAASGAEIAALSFVGQANSFVLLDERGQPLSPFILWTDERAADSDAQLEAIAAEPSFRDETGLAELTGEFMLAKLLWLQRHEPALWRRARHVCQMGDFVAWQLTGRPVAAAGLAGLTGLIDIHRLKWRASAVEAAGLSQFELPPIQRAGTAIGPITNDAAKRFGLPHTARVITGDLDQYAGAIGAGCVEQGSVCETTGTVLATVSLSRDGRPRRGGVFAGPALEPNSYWRMCFGGVSAQLLEAFRDLQRDDPSFQQLEVEAQAAQPGEVELDLPASARARRPIFLPRAGDHPRGAYVRAILAGVAQALAQQLIDLEVPAPRPLRSAGRGAQSAVWLQIKADSLGTAVETTTCPECTALGAAVLAAAGFLQRAVAELARAWIRPARTYSPQR